MTEQLAIDYDAASAKEAAGGLTVLSFGGGQDSTAILYRLLHDPVARARYAPGRLLVLMADTEDEHEATVAHVEKIRALCAARGVEFHLVGAEWRRRSWAEGGLRGFMRRTSTLMLKGQRKTCTDQLKLTPLYHFIDAWVARDQGWSALAARRGRGKAALTAFAAAHGPVSVLVGIARGEERRVQDADARKKSGEHVLSAWQRASCRTIYPLLDWGWDRADCQRYIRDLGFEVPPPSNCRLCPYMTEVELVWLHRFDRASFDEWVALEEAKLAKFAGACAASGTANRTVWGEKKLPEVLAGALETYGSWTDAQLHEYKQSHGHCVASKY